MPLIPFHFSINDLPSGRDDQRAKALSGSIAVLLYADDLLIIFSGLPKMVARLLIEARNELNVFHTFAGLGAYASDSALMLIGLWSPEDRLLPWDTGLPLYPIDVL